MQHYIGVVSEQCHRHRAQSAHCRFIDRVAIRNHAQPCRADGERRRETAKVRLVHIERKTVRTAPLLPCSDQRERQARHDDDGADRDRVQVNPKRRVGVARRAVGEP